MICFVSPGLRNVINFSFVMFSSFLDADYDSELELELELELCMEGKYKNFIIMEWR